MATYDITSNSIGTGARVEMDAGESAKVFAGIVVERTDAGGPAIIAWESNSAIEILGSVEDADANFPAILMGNATSESNNSMTVGADGSIAGDTRLMSHDSSIINMGAIDRILIYSMANGGSSAIDNSGTITDDVGIQRTETSDETLEFTNTGTIAGSEYAYYSFAKSKALDFIINNGLIDGDVELGGGNDTFGGTGIMKGNLLLGSGNDSFEEVDVKGYVDGGAGKDILTGGDDSKDRLRGGSGNDTIDGSGGNDVVSGAVGADKLTGGKGRDLFLFLDLKESIKGSNDLITDFSQKQDRIALFEIDANGKDKGNGEFDSIGDKAFSKENGELRYEIKGGSTFVYGDVDGNGKADFTIKFEDVIHFRGDDFAL